MATTTMAAPSTSTSSVLFLRRLPSPAARGCLGGPLQPRAPRLRTARLRVSLASDVSSSPDIAEEEAEHAPKVGRRVRVTAPLRVYHVVKAPDLDIQGLEGVIKQYVGVWKGKRITANFPFKVEFQVAVETQPKPVKLFVHLREDEFEYIGDDE